MRESISHIRGDVVACHECDHLHERVALPARARALCHACGSELYRDHSGGPQAALALFLAALILFILSNVFPFLSLKIGARVEDTLLISGVTALYDLGMGELGLLVFLTSIAFPFLSIIAALYILLPISLGYTPPAMGKAYRLLNSMMPWSMVSVFMLATLIAMVKLLDMAEVITGPALYALCGLLLIFAAARSSLHSALLWQDHSNSGEAVDQRRAIHQSLTACHHCHATLPADSHHCPRCDNPVHARKPDSITQTWALVISAWIMVIPANVYPVMTVIQFGRGETSTIMSGVIHLMHSGMVGLALIVFVASIVVPVMKLIMLTYLLISVQRGHTHRLRDRTRLYRITEVIGAWSMVDIFLVGLLSALVSLGALATIEPGIGAVYFAAVVVLTMIAAQRFDPRLIWDRAEQA